jgi:hypothetical protein
MKSEAEMFHLLDDRTKLMIIEKVRLNGRKVRWIGAGFSVFSAVGPWFLILDIIPTTFFFSFLIYISMVLGMGLSFVGLIYDNLIDLSK